LNAIGNTVGAVDKSLARDEQKLFPEIKRYNSTSQWVNIGLTVT